MSSDKSQTGFVPTPTGAEAGIPHDIRKSATPQAVSGYNSPPSEENTVGGSPAPSQGAQGSSYSPQQSRHTPPQSPPRRKSLDSQLIPIDPSLLDPSSDSPLATAKPQAHTDPILERFASDPYSDHSSDLSDPPHYHRSFKGISAPWPLQTSNLDLDSQATTSVSSSPATPGLGLDGLYHGERFQASRQSSVSDFDSYVGATKGFSTSASSESGFDPKDAEGDQGEGDIPPPRPKKSHARKQPEGHIKRARNAFILFRKHVTDSNLIPPSVEVKHQNISVVAAKMWREAPQEVRQKFQEQARIEKEEHAKKYPGYRYQPVFRRTDIIRRRVRKDPAEDEKVEAVAEALIKGKTGDKLEKEIKEQLVSRSEASESEAESARTSCGSRRRRREVGQLSKGAIRAQRAQARAKQMRQNLLGSNLLNMSLYNAANQNRMLTHPGAQHYSQYAMQDQYMAPVQGYDIDGNPLSYSDGQAMYPGGGLDAGAMYRLPSIDGSGLVYGDHPHVAHSNAAHQGWGDPNALGMTGDFGANDYWSGAGPSDYHYPHEHTDLNQDYHARTGAAGAYNQMHPSQYQLAPMVDPSARMSHDAQPLDVAEGQQNRQPDPRLNDWARDGQQTPSGHVMFNERLFDGALGSASIPSLLGDGRDDGLAGFDEAMAQASEIPQW